jgi:hypothetical protein
MNHLDDMLTVECRCPACNTLFTDLIHKGHVTNRRAWRNRGALAILCPYCRDRVIHTAISYKPRIGKPYVNIIPI